MATVLCTGVQPTLIATRKLILEQAGHTVVAAQNDGEIASACREFRFDVVVIGQHHPAEWKREWSALVRKQCPSARVLEIYLPGSGVAVDDADDWLPAPAIPSELTRRVAVLAGQQKTEQPLTMPDGAGSDKVPMQDNVRMQDNVPMQELEQQIRLVCLHLISAEAGQFEVTCVELEAALDEWDRLKKEDGKTSAAP